MADDHPLQTLEALVLIAVGGFVGANLRYAVAQVVPGLGGTLLANVSGSVVLGFLLYEALYTGVLAERTRVVLGTGFLSSFTTYSTFVVQSVQAGPVLFVGNVAATYALGFAGVLVGRRLARSLDGGRL
ncbi:MAG: fluoride efflux transporter CrcB [Haloarculaceae archaeon]